MEINLFTEFHDYDELFTKDKHYFHMQLLNVICTYPKSAKLYTN
jgi:hypothetical protein